MGKFLRKYFSRSGLVILASGLGIIFWTTSFFPLIRLVDTLVGSGQIATMVGWILFVPTIAINMYLNNVLFSKIYKGNRHAEHIFYFVIVLTVLSNGRDIWDFVTNLSSYSPMDSY